MHKGTPSYLIGTGGWEHAAFDQYLYPAPGADSLEKLAYYSSFFDAVEVRSTFWDESLSEKDAAGWCDAVSMNKRFRFMVKLHSSFTHKKLIKPQTTRNMRAVLHELSKRERLGALLVQFPYAFTNTSANRYHVVKLAELFSGFPVHIEFRHESWNTPGLLSFMSEHSVSPVSADLPRIKQLMPLVTGVAGETAYIRLHGRNEKGWLLNGMDARYDYLYNSREIREIGRRIEALSARCSQVVIMCNNTTGGKALASALQLSSVIRGDRHMRIPGNTMNAFPHLADIGYAEFAEETLLAAQGYRRVI